MKTSTQTFTLRVIFKNSFNLCTQHLVIVSFSIEIVLKYIFQFIITYPQYHRSYSLKMNLQKEQWFLKLTISANYGLDFDGSLNVDTLWINMRCQLLSK